MSHGVSRRSFFGGMAAAIGFLGVGKDIDLFAQGQARGAGGMRPGANSNDYDSFAHLSSNENCWGVHCWNWLRRISRDPWPKLCIAR